MRPLEKIAYSLLAAVIAAGVILSRVDAELFRQRYAAEDGPIEWATFVALVLCGFMMLHRAVRLRAHRPRLFLAVTSLWGLALLFGAGEEISWGQRVLGFETPRWLFEINRQGEFNLHNLELLGISVNRLLFSRLLLVAMATHLLLLPALAARSAAIRGLADRLAIPLPTFVQSIAWILVLVLPEILIDSDKKAEVREAGAGLMMFVTLRFPRNGSIYRIDPEPSEGSPAGPGDKDHDPS